MCAGVETCGVVWGRGYAARQDWSHRARLRPHCPTREVWGCGFHSGLLWTCSHCRLDRTWERACQLCKWWCCSMWPARGKRRGLGGALERVGIQLSGQVLGVSLTSCPEFTRPSCPLPHPALPWLPIQCWRSG